MAPRPSSTAAALPASEVSHIARLARLELSADEATRLASQLFVVLEHFEAVRSLDTTGVPPMAHSMDLLNVVRDDLVRPSLERDDVLAMAPSAKDGRFEVPRILGFEP